MSHSALRWQVSYREALAAIFIEGWIFIFLSLVGVRQALVRLLPRTLALAMSAGIGKCSTLCCSALHPDSILGRSPEDAVLNGTHILGGLGALHLESVLLN